MKADATGRGSGKGHFERKRTNLEIESRKKVVDEPEIARCTVSRGWIFRLTKYFSPLPDYHKLTCHPRGGDVRKSKDD